MRLSRLTKTQTAIPRNTQFLGFRNPLGRLTNKPSMICQKYRLVLAGTECKIIRIILFKLASFKKLP